MALVLREKTNRSGDTIRFDVVRAEVGTPEEILEGIGPGQYTLFEGSTVEKYETRYRTVQDVERVG